MRAILDSLKQGDTFFRRILMIKLRTLRTVILSTLLALLSVSFLTLTAGAQPVAPTHTGPGVSTRVVTVPLSNNPNSNIKLNKKGKAVFHPKKLACKQIQGQSCHTMTNTTSLTIDVYLNGSYFFTSAPGQVNSFFYGGAGTYVYTIPNTNPKAKLTVTVTM
jgi:hypothetical protein